MNNWKQDAILGVVLLIISALFYFPTLEFPEDVALFPSHLAPVLAFLAVWLIVAAFRRRAPGAIVLENWISYRHIAMVLLILASYALSMPYIGYVASSILLLGLFFLGMGFQRRILAVAVAVGSATVTYVLFHVVLEVPLPVGLLFEAA